MRPAADYQTVTITVFGEVLVSGSVLGLHRGPTMRGMSSIIVEDPFLIATHDSVEKRIILVALKKRR